MNATGRSIGAMPDQASVEPSESIPAAPTTSKRRIRIVGLDGPRGAACVAVLIVHVAAHYSPVTMDTYKLQLFGQALVFFFALSGFLLYLPFLRAIFDDPHTATPPATKTFIRHRLLRVFPGYLAIFLIADFGLRAVYLSNVAMQPPGTDDGVGMMTAPLGLLANLTLTHSYFPTYFQTGLNPSWSLSLELIFYAVLPVFGMLAMALRRRGFRPLTAAVVAPVALLVLGTAGKLFAPVVQHHFGVYDPTLMEWGPNWVAVYNRSFLSLADNFTFGMLAAVIFVGITSGALTGHLVRYLRWYAGGILILVLVVSLALISIHTNFSSTAVALSAGLMVLFIVAPLARGEDSTFAKIADWRPLRYLGEVSLSIYLWHFPVLLVLGRLGLMAGDGVLGLLRNVTLVLAVSVLAASVTYRFVERPAMAWAKRG
jgi:peptidoglycan/LPS O-acetylase OafA/YrhL